MNQIFKIHSYKDNNSVSWTKSLISEVWNAHWTTKVCMSDDQGVCALWMKPKILTYNILCWNWLIFNEISSFYSMILTSWCKILWKRFNDKRSSGSCTPKLSEMPTMRLLIVLILTNWRRDIGNVNKLENHNYLW